MKAAPNLEQDERASAGGTLGDVLYPDKSKPRVSEREWVELVHAVASNDQLALHGLYERAGHIVFTLAVRITGNRETAEEVALDVFHDVWRKASGYDPANGTVLGWIMNQARSRAIDRLRFERRKKRVGPDSSDAPAADEAADAQDILELKQQRHALLGALTSLTPDERQAIEAAFFADMSYAEVAARLNQPLGTVKTRIRSGIHKLRHAMAGKGGKA